MSSSTYDDNERSNVKKKKRKHKNVISEIIEENNDDTASQVSHKSKKSKKSQQESSEAICKVKKTKSKSKSSANDQNCGISINLNDSVNKNNESFIDNIDKVNTSFEKHGNILNLQISFVLKTDDNNLREAKEIILNNFGINNATNVNTEQPEEGKLKKEKHKKKHKRKNVNLHSIEEEAVEDLVEPVKVKKKKKKHKHVEVEENEECLVEQEDENSRTKAQDAVEALNQVLSSKKKKKKKKLLLVEEDEKEVEEIKKKISSEVDEEKVQKRKKKSKQKYESYRKDIVVEENTMDEEIFEADDSEEKVSKKEKKKRSEEKRSKKDKLKKKKKRNDSREMDKAKEINMEKSKKIDPLVNTLVDEEKRLIYSKAKAIAKRNSKDFEQNPKKRKNKKRLNFDEKSDIEIIDSSSSDTSVNDNDNSANCSTPIVQKVNTEIIEVPRRNAEDLAIKSNIGHDTLEQEEISNANVNNVSLSKETCDKNIKQEFVDTHILQVTETKKQKTVKSAEPIVPEVTPNDPPPEIINNANPPNVNVKCEHREPPQVLVNVKQEVAAPSNNEIIEPSSNHIEQKVQINLKNLSELLELVDQAEYNETTQSPNTYQTAEATSSNQVFYQDNLIHLTPGNNIDTYDCPKNGLSDCDQDVKQQNVLTHTSYCGPDQSANNLKYVQDQADATTHNFVNILSNNANEFIPFSNPGNVLSNNVDRTGRIHYSGNGLLPENGYTQMNQSKDEEADGEYTNEERKQIWINNTLTSEERHILRNLRIKVAFAIPQLHYMETIFREPTSEEMMKIHLLNLQVDNGPFTETDDQIIVANFKYFCKRNRYSEKSTRPFIRKRYFKLFPKDVRVNFVKCIGRNLETRLLCSIYNRFCEIYTNTETNYTDGDNEILINYMEYVPNEERGLDIMSEIFRKSYANVKNHLYELKKDKEYYRKTLYTPHYIDEIINYLVQLTFSRNVYDLKRKVITNKIWLKVSKLFNKTPRALQIFWEKTLYRLLFLNKDVNERCFQEQLIHYFIENRLYDWDTVNWKQIESIFQGCEGHKLQQILLDLFTYYVPVILHCDFQGSLLYMKKNVYTERSIANILINKI